MNNKTSLLTGAVAGLIIGAGVVYVLSGPEQTQSSSDAAEGEKKPLYWVAPMDSSYRRDKPGKSPMGMDLVPVYEEDGAQDDAAGTVRISPTVENNLGVRTAPVTSGTLSTDIHTVGYVQYDEDSLVHIHPRVEGWVDTLHVKAAGDPVKKGQPLYTLYSPQLVNAQEEFIIALRRGDAALIAAAKDRLRALQLPDEVIKTLQSSRKVRQNVTFSAPQSGVVDDLQIREGFYIKPGNTLMSIGQLDAVWVEAEVFERDAALVKAGQPVTMTLDYLPGKSWEGQVDYIYPSLNEKNRTLRVRLRFTNKGLQLKPNMFAKITLHATQGKDVLRVPSQAVIRTGNQARVVVALGEGKFKSVEVTTGQVSDDYTAILSGLKADDRVVTSAQFLIDSESSKTSDFARMSSADMPDAVWVEAEVESAMPEHRMVTLTHQAIDEWDWPVMTMDFTVDDSVDMQALANARTLHAEITRKVDDEFVVTGIHVMTQKGDTAPEPDNQATVDGTINTIDRQSRTLNISRGPIEKWGRGAATMDFVANETIDLSTLAEGDEVTFTFTVGDAFTIISLEPKMKMDMRSHDMHGGGSL